MHNDNVHIDVLDGSSTCGSDATASSTPTSGRMGSIDFFNCGIDDNGWTPPYISINPATPFMADLIKALKTPGSSFRPCELFLDMFEKYAQAHNVPSTVIAAFALQESGCNPSITGGAGEAGLMQLTHDKCYGASDGDCYDLDFNILTATGYFSKKLADSNDNLVLTSGDLDNGWYKGMIYVSYFRSLRRLNDIGRPRRLLLQTVPVADARTTSTSAFLRCEFLCISCERPSSLQQFFNAWLQNVDAYEPDSAFWKVL